MNAPWIDELRLAYMLLTRLPAGRIAGAPPALSASVWAWPLPGLAVGLAMALTAWIATSLGLPPALAAVCALGVDALITGCMHLDATADVADGFGGGRTRERKLEIMRDSHVGSYGTTALVLALAFRGAAMAALIAGGHIWAFPAAAAASRAGMAVASHLLPPARGDGLGRTAAGAGRTAALIAAAIGVAALLPLGAGAATAALAAALVAGGAAASTAQRQIGGHTGDVLGIIQTVTECAILAATVAFGGP